MLRKGSLYVNDIMLGTKPINRIFNKEEIYWGGDVVKNKGLLYGELVDASKDIPEFALYNFGSNVKTYTPTVDVENNIFYIDDWGEVPEFNSLNNFIINNKQNIKSITVFRGLDTSNVNEMRTTFQNCTSLTSLDLSNFDTSNVVDMFNLFFYCSALTSLDLSNFDTSNVTNMMQMFVNCSALTSLDLSSFDTSKVTSMHGMFNRCLSLTSLDFSNFDTSNVNDMMQMFVSCSSLTSLDLSSFDTSKVTTMRYMFSQCSSLTSLNISNFDMSNVTDILHMFYQCNSLQDIYITVEGTLMKLTNNLTSANDDYIPSTATIHYNDINYKWIDNAWQVV